MVWDEPAIRVRTHSSLILPANDNNLSFFYFPKMTSFAPPPWQDTLRDSLIRRNQSESSYATIIDQCELEPSPSLLSSLRSSLTSLPMLFQTANSRNRPRRSRIEIRLFFEQPRASDLTGG